VAQKGAIAVHGVSLTVAGVRSRSFEIALIPTTVARTKLGSLRPGDGVNLEADVIARYLETLMSENKR
jgi:riboflavin synthase